MLELSALWKPIIVSAVFVLVTLLIVHMIPGWHQRDMAAVPGQNQFMEMLRGLGIQPGEYRFPYGNTTAEMTAPAFVEKMKSGPVGMMTIRPNGELNMGKMIGLWFLYSILVAIVVAYVARHTLSIATTSIEIFRVSTTIAFCSYVLAHWQNWIWWGRSTRFTLTYSIDGVLYAIVTGATFVWLWPR